MTIALSIRLPAATPVRLRALQEALAAHYGHDGSLFLLLSSSLHQSVLNFLFNDLHKNVTASAFDGLKGSTDLVGEEVVLGGENSLSGHFYRKGQSCFFVGVEREEDLVVVRLKYGSSPEDIDLAFDIVKVVMELFSVPTFTCEESGEEEFGLEDIPAKFDVQWKERVGTQLSYVLLKQPSPGKVVTLIAPQRTFYLGHHSWAKIKLQAGGDTSTPADFMRALHQAMRELQEFDPEDAGFYENTGIFVRKPHGTVSIGSWSPDVAYFMRPFTYITFITSDGENILFPYSKLLTVAGPYATLLDELHIIVAKVPDEDAASVVERARMVQTDM